MASNNPFDNENGDDFNFGSELEKILRDMLSGQNPANLNLPIDPQSMGQIFEMFQGGFAQAEGSAEIDWSVARKTALEVAQKREKPANVPNVSQFFNTASLWVDQVTAIGSPADTPKSITGAQWAQLTSDTWIKLTEPVAKAISNVLTNSFEDQVPEEVKAQLGSISAILSRVGGSMFAMQLGQIIGKLSGEVLSAGDIGIPLITREGHQGGSLIAENIPKFSEGLSLDEAEILLFLAARESAHARLFKHSRWLSSHIFTIIHEYASGIDLNISHFHDLSQNLDLANPESIQELMRNGSLIPPKTPPQEAAHQKLETLIALVEGWVDVVTSDAAKLLPGAGAIAEMMRRRRATGGPSENAFATLIGLEMRPRKLREAVAMWRALEEATDIETRDSLWAHPDLLPTKEELEDPQALIARVQGASTPNDSLGVDFERELEKLLNPEQLSDTEEKSIEEGPVEDDSAEQDQD